jgi:predicted TIM-barrel fold metal-dependent hydrolase
VTALPTASPVPAAGPRARTAVVDVHAHHYPDTYLDACRRSDSGLEHYVRDDGRLVVTQDGAVALAAPQPMPSTADRLTMLDRAGIDLQLLSVSAPSVYRLPATLRTGLARQLNDELVSLADESAGRLRTLATLPLPDVNAAVREVERVLDDPRVAGVFACTSIDGMPLDDDRLRPLWHVLSEREAPILVHPTVAPCPQGTEDFALSLALGFMGETTNCVGRLAYSGTFERHPGIRWVFTHLGGSIPFVYHRFDNYYHQFPQCREHVGRPPSEFLRRLHFDTVTTHLPALKCTLATFDASQLLFGTDYPHVPGGLEPFTDVIRRAELPVREHEGVMGGNAHRVFNLPPIPRAKGSPSRN